MADSKNKLAQGLAQPPSKPVIRRGQGMRLSTEETPANADNLDQLANQPPAIATPIPEPVAADTSNQAGPEIDQFKRINAQTHHRTSAIDDIYRVNRGYKLREDLIKACRAFAIDEDRTLYGVMEDALTEYLERHAPELLARYNKKRKKQGDR